MRLKFNIKKLDGVGKIYLLKLKACFYNSSLFAKFEILKNWKN